MLKVFTITLVMIISLASASSVPNSVLASGTIAEPGQFPFLAHLWARERWSADFYYFTGALISDRHILTSGKYLNILYSFKGVLGAQYANQSGPEQQSFAFTLDDINFDDSATFGEGLAVITLNEPATFTDRVQPIQLPSSSDKGLNYYGWPATVTAWLGQPISRTPAYYDVIINRNEACSLVIDDKVICINQSLVSTSDTGAPLIVNTLNGPVLIGIYTSENEGEQNETTNVFIRVNEHLDYISKVIGL